MKKRCIDLYTILERTKGFDPDLKLCAAALIATEMEFRGASFRLCEYVFAWVRLSLGYSIKNLTLGVAQISVRHFMAEYAMTETEGVIAAKSVKKSFDLCCRLLMKLPDLDQETVIKSYNGKATGFYARRYAQHLSDFKSLYYRRLQS